MSECDGRTSGYMDTEVDELGNMSYRTSLRDRSVGKISNKSARWF